MDADAGQAFDDAGSDLDEMQAQGVELGARESRPPRCRLAYGEHEPVGGGVEDEAELVGLWVAA